MADTAGFSSDRGRLLLSSDAVVFEKIDSSGCGVESTT